MINDNYGIMPYLASEIGCGRAPPGLAKGQNLPLELSTGRRWLSVAFRPVRLPLVPGHAGHSNAALECFRAIGLGIHNSGDHQSRHQLHYRTAALRSFLRITLGSRGKEPMTATERQRRWRQQKRLTQSVEPPDSDDQGNAFDAQPERERPPPAWVVVPAQSAEAADHRLIEALKAPLEERTAELEERTAQLGQARRECDEARRESYEARRACDEARKGVVPKFKKVDDQIREWCMFCRKGHAQVDMIVATDLELRLAICFNCIERCNKIIAKARQRGVSAEA
jgi:hypothetical protein